jgi:hypothetical protein
MRPPSPYPCELPSAKAGATNAKVAKIAARTVARDAVRASGERNA